MCSLTARALYVVGSAKFATPANRSSYLVKAIDKPLRLQTSSRNRPETHHADSTSQPTRLTLPALTTLPTNPTLSPRENSKTSTLPLMRRTPVIQTRQAKLRSGCFVLVSVVRMNRQHTILIWRLMKRVISMRLALRSDSPNSRPTIAQEYAALLADNPLLLPSPSEKVPHQDPDSRRSHLHRLAASTPNALVLLHMNVMRRTSS
jgi:hypothetical protein